MQPIYLSIQQEETGAQIRKLMMKNGYTVRDVQGAMGFENPQAVYKLKCYTNVVTVVANKI